MSGPDGLACRGCGAPLGETFADLGMSPLANTYLAAEDLDRPLRYYPLHARVCAGCFLVQLPAAVDPADLFSEYAYFSSYSQSWLAHADRYAAMATARFGLGPQSRVVEIASNDGYLLRAFQARGVPVLGIEPARNVAAAAVSAGIPTRCEFFGLKTAEKLAGEGLEADLLVGNNVLAHVPDLHDFVAGLHAALKPQGVLTLEFPHLLRLIEGSQFDTIYHEHYSYLALGVVEALFLRHGLVVFDVEELPTHGGSLRVFARRRDWDSRPATGAVAELVARERAGGLAGLERYRAFARQAAATKRRLLRFLIDAREEGKQVAGYGAPAKGNTLLNFCGIDRGLLDYTVDLSPHKQGRFLPGSRIPIHPPGRLAETRPDYVLILPWNLSQEITAQMAAVRDWGGRFVVAIPEVRVLP